VTTTVDDAHARARAAFLEKRAPESVDVVHQGVTVEVRQPTIAARSWVFEGGNLGTGDDGEVKVDMAALSARSIIACTFMPGTDTALFTGSDESSLKGQVVGGGVDKLATAALRMLGTNAAAVDQLAARALAMLRKR